MPTKNKETGILSYEIDGKWYELPGLIDIDIATAAVREYGFIREDDYGELVLAIYKMGKAEDAIGDLARLLKEGK